MSRNLLLLFSCLLFSITLVGQTANADDFYNTDVIQEIKLTIKQKNWRSLLDSLRKHGDEYLVGTANIGGQAYSNIGIKYRASRSFKVGAKRNSLHIKLNFIDKNQGHQGYKSLKLSNALRDPSMVREVLGFEIARKYMPAPKANYAKVYINEEYYGLFSNIEQIDAGFLTSHFGDSDGSFFKCSPDLKSVAADGCKKNVFAALMYEEDAACYLNNYELVSENGWDDLIQLTKTLAQNPDKIDRILNVDETLWMLAFNNVVVNLSSYSGRQSQNFYLYQDSFGLFTPIIWDLNLAFGSYKSAKVGSDLRLKQLQELDPLLHLDNEYKPLISQLLQNPAYQKTYLSHVRTILYDNFVSGDYVDRAVALQQLIQVSFINDPNRKYSLEDFKKSLKSTIGQRSRIPGINELMGKRTKLLKKNQDLRIVPPAITEVMAQKRAQYASNINHFSIQAKVDKLPQKVKLMYRYDKADSFKEAIMLDDGKNNDTAAGDGIYTAKVGSGPTNQIEYYIVAENTAAISFEPSNYMYQLHKSTIAEVN
ncbi:MAG: CotH kinase family protein [Saprospiraceae bacterium]